MTYSAEQLKAMCPAQISECSQKHVQSVIAELIETAQAQPASVPALDKQAAFEAWLENYPIQIVGDDYELCSDAFDAGVLAASPQTPQPAQAVPMKGTLNLNDPSVQKRLAAQWGYVQAPAPAHAAPQPEAQPAMSFGDALRIARGCTDYGGGYRGDQPMYEAYQHGINTVINALNAADKRGFSDTQVAALHAIGAAPSAQAEQAKKPNYRAECWPESPHNKAEQKGGE